jgi:hypothetical protein
MYLKVLESPPHHYRTPTCREKDVGYHLITERHIQAMWLEQKYFKNITTADGHPIEVISPGIWNAEAGPDFLKAHLRIDGADLFGDIEIHLSDDSWIGHKHHIDAAYDRVILHVGYWSPKQPVSIITSGGYKIPCTHLENFLTIPESRLLKLIDLDLYPYHRFSGSGRCAEELFSQLPLEETVDLLASAGLWRLKQKWQFLEAKMEKCRDILVSGIAMALGYKHNSSAFLELYRYLSEQEFADEQEIFAEALAATGFFQQTYRKRWFLSSSYQRLAAIYDSGNKSRPYFKLQLDHIRPANHPIRRLAYMAQLIVHKKELEQLPRKVENLWIMERDGNRDWKVLREQLYEVIPDYKSDYWLGHYAFEAEEQSKKTAWIGDELKREIVVNIILPYLYQGISVRGDSNEIAAFANFFSSIPATKAKKTSYLKHRFFGDDRKEALISRADIQQGAYQIHKDFCIHYEASCQGCPFVKKFQESSRNNEMFSCSSKL